MPVYIQRPLDGVKAGLVGHCRPAAIASRHIRSHSTFQLQPQIKPECATTFYSPFNASNKTREKRIPGVVRPLASRMLRRPVPHPVTLIRIKRHLANELANPLKRYYIKRFFTTPPQHVLCVMHMSGFGVGPRNDTIPGRGTEDLAVSASGTTGGYRDTHSRADQIPAMSPGEAIIFGCKSRTTDPGSLARK